MLRIGGAAVIASTASLTAVGSELPASSTAACASPYPLTYLSAVLLLSPMSLAICLLVSPAKWRWTIYSFFLFSKSTISLRLPPATV